MQKTATVTTYTCDICLLSAKGEPSAFKQIHLQAGEVLDVCLGCQEGNDKLQKLLARADTAHRRYLERVGTQGSAQGLYDQRDHARRFL